MACVWILFVSLFLPFTLQFKVEVKRHNHGDIFTYIGSNCSSILCSANNSRYATQYLDDPCTCQCYEEFPVFRDDTQQCVQTLAECPLAEFILNQSAEKIPLVFLPQYGQLIYPQAEIALSGVAAGTTLLSPACIINNGLYLWDDVWQNINASEKTEGKPFGLYREDGATRLQWLGASRDSLVGRLVLVRLLCRDTGHPKSLLFKPCVSFRVAGRTSSEIAASFFNDDADSPVINYVVIGICSTVVLFVYVLAISVYLVIRKYKSTSSLDSSLPRRRRYDNVPQPPQRHKEKLKKSMESKTETINTADNQSEDKPKAIPRKKAAKVNTQQPASPKEKLAKLSSFDEKLPHSATQRERKKLYFNPSFFDLDNLQSPPPAALEFLTKLRIMIAGAKEKLQSIKFEPSLRAIPEDDRSNGPELESYLLTYQNPNFKQDSLNSKSYTDEPSQKPENLEASPVLTKHCSIKRSNSRLEKFRQEMANKFKKMKRKPETKPATNKLSSEHKINISKWLEHAASQNQDKIFKPLEINTHDAYYNPGYHENCIHPIYALIYNQRNNQKNAFNRRELYSPTDSVETLSTGSSSDKSEDVVSVIEAINSKTSSSSVSNTPPQLKNTWYRNQEEKLKRAQTFLDHKSEHVKVTLAPKSQSFKQSTKQEELSSPLEQDFINYYSGNSSVIKNSGIIVTSSPSLYNIPNNKKLLENVSNALDKDRKQRNESKIAIVNSYNEPTNKLTIQVQGNSLDKRVIKLQRKDSFVQDSLERNHLRKPLSRHQSFLTDSLERPTKEITPQKSSYINYSLWRTFEAQKAAKARNIYKYNIYNDAFESEQEPIYNIINQNVFLNSDKEIVDKSEESNSSEPSPRNLTDSSFNLSEVETSSMHSFSPAVYNNRCKLGPKSKTLWYVNSFSTVSDYNRKFASDARFQENFYKLDLDALNPNNTQLETLDSLEPIHSTKDNEISSSKKPLLTMSKQEEIQHTMLKKLEDLANEVPYGDESVSKGMKIAMNLRSKVENKLGRGETTDSLRKKWRKLTRSASVETAKN